MGSTSHDTHDVPILNTKYESRTHKVSNYTSEFLRSVNARHSVHSVPVIWRVTQLSVHSVPVIWRVTQVMDLPSTKVQPVQTGEFTR